MKSLRVADLIFVACFVLVVVICVGMVVGVYMERACRPPPVSITNSPG
jgi:hypothetical protein